MIHVLYGQRGVGWIRRSWLFLEGIEKQGYAEDLHVILVPGRASLITVLRVRTENEICLTRR